jgi:hypothetical protein
MSRTATAVVAFLLLLAASGLAANQYGVANEHQVSFHEEVRVGSTILPPGEYRVIHVMQGDTHLMFFRRLNARKGHMDVASASCTLQPLPAPARDTLMGFSSGPGVKALTLMQFKGETAQHVF